VRVGQAETGRVITAAATIMICVFLSFLLLGERQVGEFGIGLAAAVALDAFVLRMLLVPSLMHLLGKANWWLPPGWTASCRTCPSRATPCSRQGPPVRQGGTQRYLDPSRTRFVAADLCQGRERKALRFGAVAIAATAGLGLLAACSGSSSSGSGTTSSSTQCAAGGQGGAPGGGMGGTTRPTGTRPTALASGTSGSGTRPTGTKPTGARPTGGANGQTRPSGAAGCGGMGGGGGGGGAAPGGGSTSGGSS
jgi:hypothetical protein